MLAKNYCNSDERERDRVQNKEINIWQYSARVYVVRTYDIYVIFYKKIYKKNTKYSYIFILLLSIEHIHNDIMYDMILMHIFTTGSKIIVYEYELVHNLDFNHRVSIKYKILYITFKFKHKTYSLFFSAGATSTFFVTRYRLFYKISFHLSHIC